MDGGKTAPGTAQKKNTTITFLEKLFAVSLLSVIGSTVFEIFVYLTPKQ